MNAFFQALTFLTRIPVRFQAKPEAWAKSTAYYPLVGLIIGMIVAVVAVLLSPFLPTMLIAVLTLVCWIWLTGGLHLDGLMDTADAVGSSRSRERMLEIMKDSRVGAMGVIAAVLVVLVKFTAIVSIIDGIRETMALSFSGWEDTKPLVPLFGTWGGDLVFKLAGGHLFTIARDFFEIAGLLVTMLLIPPILARAGLLLSIYFWPYLNANGGIGSGMKEGLTPLRLAVALLLAAGTVLWISGTIGGLLFLIVWLIITIRFNRRMQKLLGGLTGDTYGCLTEITETALLVTGAFIVHMGGLI
ncbi:adenosylcobinamide-GDP ribazoletransferase [Brevibacillus dissolubilis]|uniref:adenosylcobinamide-GDP ribazoletransferase n=1 Tax=Brevibacillus dissolubilis TaxID=1844116 RepID=UPI0011166100|nr:adenosylcobinamide-GDP ribazoletransferase [Brevibacillus dissolubilis]